MTRADAAHFAADSTRYADRERNPIMSKFNRVLHAVTVVLLVTAFCGCQTSRPSASPATRTYRGLSHERFVSSVRQFPFERESKERTRLKGEFRNLGLGDTQQAVEARLGMPDVCNAVYTDKEIISFNSAWFLIKQAPKEYTKGDAIISVNYDANLRVIGMTFEHMKK
jgi:hypothetical protein